jgi:hypothetical protein
MTYVKRGFRDPRPGSGPRPAGAGAGCPRRRQRPRDCGGGHPAGRSRHAVQRVQPARDLAAGSHTIVAVYSGDSDDTGSQGSLTYGVEQAAQTITTTSTPPTTLPVGGTYRPTATGGASGNPVTFTATGACTISGGVVTVTKAGTCTVQSAALGASSS